MKTLFEETRIGTLKIKNRFVRSATYDGAADPQGHTTPMLTKIYEDLAAGGVGMIITGMAAVLKSEQRLPGQMGIYDDSFIGDYRGFVSRIHKQGSAVILQIVAMGSQDGSRPEERNTTLGPSDIEDVKTRNTPRKMTLSDIHDVEDAFARAALRAQEAGFDGIQIHAAHGYLLSKFLTPYYNRRTDEYGGSIENRSRFLMETYRAVRAKVGPSYAVLLKINCDDFMDDGMNFEDCRFVCGRLAEEGVSAVEISGGNPSSRANEGHFRDTAKSGESYFLSYAEQIKREINIPVISVGGHRDIGALSKYISDDRVDYISLCRPFIRESGLVNRWQHGSTTPAACISCNQCRRRGGTICVFNRNNDA